MEFFYKEVESERKGQKKKTSKRLQKEFKRRKIFDLNKKFNVGMLLRAVRSGKVFADKQKLR